MGKRMSWTIWHFVKVSVKKKWREVSGLFSDERFAVLHHHGQRSDCGCSSGGYIDTGREAARPSSPSPNAHPGQPKTGPDSLLITEPEWQRWRHSHGGDHRVRLGHRPDFLDTPACGCGHSIRSCVHTCLLRAQSRDIPIPRSAVSIAGKYHSVSSNSSIPHPISTIMTIYYLQSCESPAWRYYCATVTVTILISAWDYRPIPSSICHAAWDQRWTGIVMTSWSGTLLPQTGWLITGFT